MKTCIQHGSGPYGTTMTIQVFGKMWTIAASNASASALSTEACYSIGDMSQTKNFALHDSTFPIHTYDPRPKKLIPEVVELVLLMTDQDEANKPLRKGEMELKSISRSHLYISNPSKEYLCEKILIEHAEDLEPYTMVWARFHGLCHLYKWVTSLWVKDGKIYYGFGDDVVFSGPKEYAQEHGIVDKYVHDTWTLKEVNADEVHKILDMQFGAREESRKAMQDVIAKIHEAGASL